MHPILIACTRHLLEQLKQANSTPLKNWIKSRWQDLIDLALTEIKVEDRQFKNETHQPQELTKKGSSGTV